LLNEESDYFDYFEIICRMLAAVHRLQDSMCFSEYIVRQSLYSVFFAMGRSGFAAGSFMVQYRRMSFMRILIRET